MYVNVYLYIRVYTMHIMQKYIRIYNHLVSLAEM